MITFDRDYVDDYDRHGWAGHVGWSVALRAYLWKLITLKRPVLKVMRCKHEHNWFILFHNR